MHRGCICSFIRSAKSLYAGSFHPLGDCAMQITTECPRCHEPLMLVLPHQHIHNLPAAKLVGITHAYADCQSCKAKGEEQYRFEAFLTIAMSPMLQENGNDRLSHVNQSGDHHVSRSLGIDMDMCGDVSGSKHHVQTANV